MPAKKSYSETLEIRPAWQLCDPGIERDAELFWRSQQLLPATVDIGERLQELCITGYDGHTLVGLTTARVRYISFLGVKLAMVRVAVAQDRWRQHVGATLTEATRELLQEWSLKNPHEEVLGIGSVTQVRHFRSGARLPAFRPGSRMGFIGWTANGEQFRAAWFDHATIPLRQPGVFEGTKEPDD